jgi:hypothetical protein
LNVPFASPASKISTKHKLFVAESAVRIARIRHGFSVPGHLFQARSVQTSIDERFFPGVWREPMFMHQQKPIIAMRAMPNRAAVFRTRNIPVIDLTDNAGYADQQRDYPDHFPSMRDGKRVSTDPIRRGMRRGLFHSSTAHSGNRADCRQVRPSPSRRRRLWNALKPDQEPGRS